MKTGTEKKRKYGWSLGAALGLVTAGLAISLVAALPELATGEMTAYGSLVAWIVGPTLFWLGFFIAAFVFTRRILRKNSGSTTPLRTLALAAVALMIAGWTVVAGFHAYEYTESDVFCGSACHQVMHPEKITHEISPHASVSCASCHVGRSVSGYVEAKLYGVKELYWLLTDTYHRPVRTPIQAFKPVRENCTGCHWDGQYWGKLHRDYSHYITANDNQEWTLKMNVKVGGMYRGGEQGEGIHWHMKLDSKVYYVARDRQLQDIPWVKLVESDGRETVFEKDDGLTPEELSAHEPREMGCFDCHNRPAHQFKAPILALDDAMRRGAIKADLPEIKAKGVELLAADDYQNHEEAAERIQEALTGFYRENHPALFEERQADVQAAADQLITLYRQNFFPTMKADWRAYPDNIGHFLFEGCFRCHGGEHKSEDGRTISADCSLCHDIVVQGPPGEVESDPRGLEFRHPVDFGVPVSEMGRCTDCHDGALGG